MSAKLNADPAMIEAYPFAVSVEQAGTVIYMHFDNKQSASLFAYLMGNSSDATKVRRYVATAFDNVERQEWREVTYFL